MKAFLMIGQSNMSGRGYLQDLPEIQNEHVFVLRDGAWVPGKEPVVLDKPAMAGAGMGLAFGATIHLFTGEDVGLIPCSLGGTPLAQWMEGERLFETAVEQSAAAMRLGAQLSGILWHQGESDSKEIENAFTYLKRMEQMTRALLERLQAEAAKLSGAQSMVCPMPLIVGELGDYLDFNGPSKFHRVVNDQLHKFAERAPERACVAARELPDRGDSLHFSTLSQRRLGVRYAGAWADIVQRLTEKKGASELSHAAYV